MSQIHVNILKQGLKSEKIFSVSFFTMNDPYRDFTKYQKYLVRFFEYAKVLPDFQVRVYTDDTGSEFALKASADNDQVSVYHFDCPEFRDPQGKGHIGVFGPMVRFLPLFEEHEIVWISDIDVREWFIDPAFLKQMIKNNCDFSISTFPCYFRKAFSNKYTIIAHRIISRVQLPRALFTRFLTKLNSGQLNDKVDLLNAENKGKPPSRVPYCTDELFLNTSVYNWLRNHDLKFYIEIDYLLLGLIPGAVSELFKYGPNTEKLFYRFSLERDPKYIPTLTQVFRKILGHYKEKYPCLEDVLRKLTGKKLYEIQIVNSKDL